MSNFRRGRQIPIDAPQDPAAGAKAALFACAAAGCPIPATLRNESGTALCTCHFGANAQGWPKATAVAIQHATLLAMARSASCAATPDAQSEELARDLFTIALDAGLKFSADLRAKYKANPMRLRFAGSVIEAAIRQQAIDAAAESPVLAVGEQHESALARLIAGVANQVKQVAA